MGATCCRTRACCTQRVQSRSRCSPWRTGAGTQCWWDQPTFLGSPLFSSLVDVRAVVGPRARLVFCRPGRGGRRHDARVGGAGRSPDRRKLESTFLLSPACAKFSSVGQLEVAHEEGQCALLALTKELDGHSCTQRGVKLEAGSGRGR